MTDRREPTPRTTSQQIVKRLTRALAALALVGTAAFGAAAASATRHHTSTSVDGSSGDVVVSDDTGSSSYQADDGSGYGFGAPSQGVLPSSGGAPSATSGGS